jgi:hypothetical protein
MRLNVLYALLAGTVASLILAPAAQAAPLFYEFTFVPSLSIGTPVGNFSGELEVDGTTITNITGSGSLIGTITGLLPIGSGFDNDSDNVFSPVAPFLTNFGVAFSTTNVPDLNMYAAAQTAVQPSPGNGSFGSLSVSLAAVPEPTSLPLLAAGLVGLAAVGRRRGIPPKVAGQI